MEDNIVMLAAILQRRILDGVEAIEPAAQRHAVWLAAGPPIHSRQVNR